MKRDNGLFFKIGAFLILLLIIVFIVFSIGSITIKDYIDKYSSKDVKDFSVVYDKEKRKYNIIFYHEGIYNDDIQYKYEELFIVNKDDLIIEYNNEKLEKNVCDIEIEQKKTLFGFETTKTTAVLKICV